MSFKILSGLFLCIRCRRLTHGNDSGQGVKVCIMVLPLTLALPKCVHLPSLRHLSLMTKIYGLLQLIMSTPLGGGHIIFAFSAVRRPTWFPDILGNSSYPIFTKFGMQVYWVNSLYGIAFGDDSSIAN